MRQRPGFVSVRAHAFLSFASIRFDNTNINHSAMAQTPTPALEGLDTRVDIRRWFNEPTAFPDLTVKCGSRSFLVHRVVLCDCSEWFKKALTGGTHQPSSSGLDYGGPRETCTARRADTHGFAGFIESGGNNIQLHEDNEDVVTYMLRYCYNFDILEELLEDELSFVVQVFAAAEKYMLPHLARRCATAFKMLAGGEWANFSFETVIREVYTTTSDVDRVLRNPIVDIIMKHAEVLFREDGSQGLSDVSSAGDCHKRDLLTLCGYWVTHRNLPQTSQKRSVKRRANEMLLRGSKLPATLSQ